MLICRSATVFENIKATREFTHLLILLVWLLVFLLFTCIIIVIIAIVIVILAFSIPTEQCLPIS